MSTFQLQISKGTISREISANTASSKGQSFQGFSDQKSAGTHRMKTTRKNIKTKMKFDYDLAGKFVHFQLKQQLEYDPSKKIVLPKVSILNAFVKWCKQNNHALQYQYMNVIQMRLTNEIKKYFPSISQNSKSFQGIKFKNQFMQYMLCTDIKHQSQVPEEEDSVESPPLPTFDDDNLAEDYP